MNKSFAVSGAAFSILVLLLTLLANLSKNTTLVGISQLVPMITVILLLIALPGRKEALKLLGIAKIGGLKWYAAALLSIVPIAVGFLAAWALGIANLPSADFLAKGTAHFTVPQYAWYVTLNSWAPIMLIMMFIFSFGEEIGWRGYLQPRLTKAFGIKKSILITAAVWTCFHYPFYLNGYNEDGNVWINMLLFSVMIFPLSVFMGWVRWRSQSVWPAVIIHMIINLGRSWLEQLFFEKSTGWSYIAGESGIVTIAVWAIAALFIWKKLLVKAKPVETKSSASASMSRLH
ncbi:hypothetical protein J2TS6_25930 [Paenibacillus albilobatus]|uniref:CAAX prenyl protease 2/Lysostaphin resistance protein A-like domain-containing protein n=1 Tax=Paenibacillus albilobatus TaxID=2716884 RepID=A0A920CCD5_9BACL|nr:CPBP family intramembrane glutamic endopeptidase [Paenibacillus albilobatus]GIO31452.1 hypothetical protein J2TS6_25930 [Paenibacillus albilobatus]